MFEGRIDRGMKLLDRKIPGWVDKVVVEDIDILRNDKCILGQVYELYSTAVDVLKLDILEERVNFGFTAILDFDNYDVLNNEWKTAINERKVAA